MMILKFKKLNETAVMPQKGSEKAACFDLVANRIEEVGPGKIKIFFGLAADIPMGYQLELMPRSSFCLKDWVQQNTPGQIDEDYKGEIAMFLQALPIGVNTNFDENALDRYILNYPAIPYNVGERAAQCKLVKVEQYKIEETETLSESKRGIGGFGSSGKLAFMTEHIGPK